MERKTLKEVAYIIVKVGYASPKPTGRAVSQDKLETLKQELSCCPWCVSLLTERILQRRRDATSRLTWSKTIWPSGGQKVAFRRWEQAPVLQPQVCRFGRGLFPRQASQGGHSPAKPLNAVLWVSKQRTQLSCAWTFDLKRPWDDKCVDICLYMCKYI